MRQTPKALSWLAVFSLLVTVCLGDGMAATRLDTTFGNNGFVVRDFGSGDDEILDLAPQTDGKIVVAGYYNNGAVKNLVVARYQSTGELDTDFNNDGIFSHSSGSGDSVVWSLAIQTDGKIVVAGAANDGDNNIAIIRLTADGFLDNGFAGSGQLLLPVTDGGRCRSEY